MDRAPDAYGLQQYTQLLDSGTSRITLALDISESAEHQQDTAAALAMGFWEPDEPASGLALLYDASVQRAPDAYGLSAYEAELAAGTTFRQIANQMAAAPEFQARYASLDDRAFVDALYLNTVHRAADPYGEAAYVSELSHGYTRGDVLYQTAMGEEHQSLVLSHYDPLLTAMI